MDTKIENIDIVWHYIDKKDYDTFPSTPYGYYLCAYSDSWNGHHKYVKLNNSYIREAKYSYGCFMLYGENIDGELYEEEIYPYAWAELKIEIP